MFRPRLLTTVAVTLVLLGLLLTFGSGQPANRLPLALAASTGGTSGLCTAPTGTMTGDHTSTKITTNWWVNSDVWTTSGKEKVAVCDQSSWTATVNETTTGGEIRTYPDTEYDVGGRGTGTGHTAKGAGPISGFTSITSTFVQEIPLRSTVSTLRLALRLSDVVACCRTSSGTPASTRAPRNMSPEIPAKQSRYAIRMRTLPDYLAEATAEMGSTSFIDPDR